MYLIKKPANTKGIGCFCLAEDGARAMRSNFT